MSRALSRYGFAVIVAAMAVTGPACADKAHDTLRVAFDQPVRVIDALYNPNPEANLVDRAVMDNLISYDVATKSYRGQVAESWTQIDPTTLEIKLRHGIKFTDGTELDADDVIYSFNFAIDPNVNFLFKDSRFGWIDRVEKIDRYTVRVHSKDPTAIMLARLWSGPPILPAHIHSQLADKTDFGRKPVGTGPYKVESFDPATGAAVLVKNPLYNWGGYEPPAKIGRIEIEPIPDAQTRLAKIMVGDLDLIFNADYDDAKNVASQNPAYTVFVAPTISFSYILFDAADRSGIHVFKDKRVREAMLRAIDRDALRKALLPPEFSSQPAMAAMCHPAHFACAWSEQPVSYDPARAKALLAEAGLADGFDLELMTWGQAKTIAEAVAGDLRKIGVRATVNAATVNVFQKARGDGKAQTQVTLWDNGGGAPDVDNTAAFFFLPGSRNYNNDADLTQWTADGSHEMDPAKRTAIYRRLFDKVTDERYAMPLVELPAVLVQSKDLVVDTNHLKPEGFLFNRLSWTP
jgi:peptide/nickel transport system substrate-binding protein